MSDLDLPALSLQAGKKLELEDFALVCVRQHPVVVDAASLEKVEKNAISVATKKATREAGEPIRGLQSEDSEPCEEAVSRAALLFLVSKLVLARFGVRALIVETLVSMLNKRTVPMFSGSSEHAGFELIDVLGGVRHSCYTPSGLCPSSKALQECGLVPVELNDIEIAFFSHTEFLATGSMALFLSGVSNLTASLDVIASLSCEASGVSIDAFESSQYELYRQHRGQMNSVSNTRLMLEGSKRCGSDSVKSFTPAQIPLAMKHIPQVNGPVVDCLAVCRKVIELELGSSENGPVCDPSDRLNPYQTLLAAKNALDALILAVDGSIARKGVLVATTMATQVSTVTTSTDMDMIQKRPVSVLRDICRVFTEELKSASDVLDSIEAAIVKATEETSAQKGKR